VYHVIARRLKTDEAISLKVCGFFTGDCNEIAAPFGLAMTGEGDLVHLKFSLVFLRALRGLRLVGF